MLLQQKDFLIQKAFHPSTGGPAKGRADPYQTGNAVVKQVGLQCIGYHWELYNHLKQDISAFQQGPSKRKKGGSDSDEADETLRKKDTKTTTSSVPQ